MHKAGKRKTLLLLVFVLLLTLLTGCRQQASETDATESGDQTSDVSGEAETEPTEQTVENYAAVIQITINPELELYLDENGIVFSAMEVKNVRSVAEQA